MSDLKNVKPLDDFNWDEFENGTSANVSKTDLEKAYDETLNKVTEHQVVEGTVISVDKKEVIVNIGYKSDGIIPASEFRYNPDLKVGDKIATLVSLSLTPLRIDKIKEIRPDVDQVDIDGKAILFESGIYAKIPSDLPEKLVMSALDVAGAPAQVAKLVRPGNTVLIIGAAGKSGMLCCYEARKRVGVTGKVIGLCYSPEEKERLDKLGFCHEVVCMDARQPIPVLEKITELTNGEMCDITINNVNVPDTEMTSILCTKNTGIVYFFSMATSFTKAALGAEGVGSDVTMIIGNGYTKGHAEITLQEFRECEPLRKIFTELYA